ncbi:MAG: NAD-dependent epimerase/dehydratase family protein [FCB group bacterium]|nr:NAD-dependent epimerase/dehydratase family protein [FCB group bacterium]
MTKQRVFITGIAGFVGRYLAEELWQEGYQVGGSIHEEDPQENIAFLKGKASLVPLNILDQKRCQQIIAKFNPHYIFHLAAFSSVGRSFGQERLTYQVNFDGTLNILQAAVGLKLLRKFVYISSAECYGQFRPQHKTLTEEQSFNPLSPYAVSKVAAEYACRFYWHRHKLPVTVARSFNHSGPGQNENFVIPSFAKQIALIEKGKAKPIMHVGNLAVKRDLSDVRDIVKGYYLLMQKGRPGQAYHFCSGKAVAIETVLKGLLKLSPKKITVKIDKKRFRQNDIPYLRGDNKKAGRELGYNIRYNLKTTLLDTLNYWRKKVEE